MFSIMEGRIKDKDEHIALRNNLLFVLPTIRSAAHGAFTGGPKRKHSLVLTCELFLREVIEMNDTGISHIPNESGGKEPILRIWREINAREENRIDETSESSLSDADESDDNLIN